MVKNQVLASLFPSVTGRKSQEVFSIFYATRPVLLLEPETEIKNSFYLQSKRDSGLDI